MALGTVYGVAAKKYSASLMGWETPIARAAGFITEIVKPKTVAWLASDSEDSRNTLNGAEGIEGLRDRLKAKGITIVSEQFFPRVRSTSLRI
jgi:hypothetical protein